MSLSPRSALAAALAVTLLASSAAAEPLHIKSPGTLKTDGGSELRLDPGFFLPEPEWRRLDLEVKTIQDENTRLKAENQVFRDESTPGWVTVGLIVGAFIVGGYVGAKF